MRSRSVGPRGDGKAVLEKRLCSSPRDHREDLSKCQDVPTAADHEESGIMLINRTGLVMQLVDHQQSAMLMENEYGVSSGMHEDVNIDLHSWFLNRF
jgi:hypothetical protein